MLAYSAKKDAHFLQLEFGNLHRSTINLPESPLPSSGTVRDHAQPILKSRTGGFVLQMECEIVLIAWKQSRTFRDSEGMDTMLSLDEKGFISVNKKVSLCFVVWSS